MKKSKETNSQAPKNVGFDDRQPGLNYVNKLIEQQPEVEMVSFRPGVYNE